MFESIIKKLTFCLFLLSMVLITGNSAYAKVKVAKPAVSISSTGTDYVKLSITSKNPKLSGYVIYCGKKKVKTVKAASGSVKVSYKNKGLKKNSSYTYKIRAFRTSKKKKYYSPWCRIKAKTDKKKINLKTMTIKATKCLTNQITLKFSGVYNKDTVVKGKKYNKIDGYIIYRDDMKINGDYYSGKWSGTKKIKTIKAGSDGKVSSTYVDKDVKFGYRYSYYCRSFCTINGKKYYSDESTDCKTATGYGQDDVKDQFTGFKESEENADFEKKMCDKINVFRRQVSSPDLKLNQDLCNLALQRAKARAEGKLGYESAHNLFTEYCENYFANIENGKYLTCLKGENWVGISSWDSPYAIAGVWIELDDEDFGGYGRAVYDDYPHLKNYLVPASISNGGNEQLLVSSCDWRFALAMWMGSKGHRNNMLGKEYTDFGVAYYKGQWYQIFMNASNVK